MPRRPLPLKWHLTLLIVGVLLPQTLARSQGGLGLGLALVKGLVELHGGTVGVESGGAGLGTRVTILLPLAAPEAEEPVLSAPRGLPLEVLPPGVGQGLHPDDAP